ADDPQFKALPAAAQQQNIASLDSPWLRFFLDYDPAPALARLRCPVLALFGSRDLQVPPEANRIAMKEALAASGSRDVEIDDLDGLNHLCQHATTGSPAEYSAIEETMAPEAQAKITTWIMRHSAAAAQKGAPRSS